MRSRSTTISPEKFFRTPSVHLASVMEGSSPGTKWLNTSVPTSACAATLPNCSVVVWLSMRCLRRVVASGTRGGDQIGWIGTAFVDARATLGAEQQHLGIARRSDGARPRKASNRPSAGAGQKTTTGGCGGHLNSSGYLLEIKPLVHLAGCGPGPHLPPPVCPRRRPLP